ncbi:hypothetical protein CROQUDRAFT_99867 [Cronartium quercuum f. sp. fusiforme G11]|uniref:Uncharacterized protein n=1 Tax=Cronartium quercuum f. sp. fusiforme G11 TaxID=708437 RepID=A0A9P6N7U3_9BASI|nr:hypothetical protein CROQUDRAFT_99867 [Cronartium quercuum f. sp. fusiforme G11]
MAGETADETPEVHLRQNIKFKIVFVGGLQQADNYGKGLFHKLYYKALSEYIRL